MSSHLPHITLPWGHLQFTQFGKYNIFHSTLPPSDMVTEAPTVFIYTQNLHGDPVKSKDQPNLRKVSFLEKSWGSKGVTLKNLKPVGCLVVYLYLVKGLFTGLRTITCMLQQERDLSDYLWAYVYESLQFTVAKYNNAFKQQLLYIEPLTG